MRECLVEERLSVGEREPLSMAQELFPRDGVKSRTQAGLIFFRESHGAGVEVGEHFRKLRGNGPDLSRIDGSSGSRCRSAREGGTEPGKKRIKNDCKLL